MNALPFAQLLTKHSFGYINLVHFGWLGLAFALTLASYQAQLQTIPPLINESIVWTSLGPPGACINQVAVDPQVPTILYASTGEAIYKSEDSGATWRALDLETSPLRLVQDIAIDPQTPSRLYVSTAFQGIFRSVDSGVTWQRVRPEGQGPLGKVVIDPRHPEIVYTVNYYGSLLRSRDHGETWEEIASGLPAFIEMLALDTQRVGVLYAATLEGVIRSVDSGVTWQPRSNGLPLDQVYTLAIDPVNSEVLYAGLQAGLYRSTDGGTNWQMINNGLALENDSWLKIDPEDSATLYAGTREGLYRSRDGGTNWQTLGGETLAGVGVYALVLNPQTSAELYAGTCSRGVWHSSDGGVTWESNNVGLSNMEIIAFTLDPQNPATLYLMTWNDLARTDDGGGSWRHFLVPTNAFVHTVAVDPQHPATIYAATFDGVFRSVDRGATWTTINAGLTNTSTESFVMDPQTPKTLFVATVHGIFRSSNGGDNWSQVAPAHICTDNLAISLQQPKMIYAGFAFAYFCRSEDGGDNWQTFSAQTSDGTIENINRLIVDPRHPTQLYAATGRGVLRSNDGGSTWTAAITNPITTEVYSLVINNQAPFTLYAGTPVGIFRSNDSGDSWELVAPLPQEPLQGQLFVHNLAIDPQRPTYLYSNGHKKGIFVIDLEMASPTTVTNAAYNVRNTSATLVGTVGAINAAVRFEVTTASGNYSVGTTLPAGKATAADPLVSLRTVGLQPGTTYYYRVAATNDTGATHGREQRFTTDPTLPILHASNGTSGASGSTFLVKAKNFAPYSQLVITANGWVVGIVSVAANGQAACALFFPGSVLPGVYIIRVAEQVPGSTQGPIVASDTELQLTIEPTAPLRVDTSGAVVISVLPPTVYLPLINR